MCNKDFIKMDRNKLADLKDALTSAEANLKEDIYNIGYIQQEYFEQVPTKEEFYLQYFEISNKLNTIIKSMLYNLKSIQNNQKEL